MKEIDTTQFEVHDEAVLANARSIMSATESPRMWAQAVIDAVKRNEEWRGERCLNLLAPEAPTSPMVRALLSAEIGTRAAEGHPLPRLVRADECLPRREGASTTACAGGHLLPTSRTPIGWAEPQGGRDSADAPGRGVRARRPARS